MNYYLIDDDDLIRLTWEMRAKKAGVTLTTFASHLKFLDHLSNIPKDSFIYIDSELGQVKGETIALKLHEQGFQNISITSGHPPEHFKHYGFLKSIIPKSPPF